MCILCTHTHARTHIYICICISQDAGSGSHHRPVYICMHRYRRVCAYPRTQAAAATIVKSAVALVGLGMGATVIHSYLQLPATDGVIGATMWVLSTVFFVWVCSPLLAGYGRELGVAAHRGVPRIRPPCVGLQAVPPCAAPGGE